jgi:DNA mismatch endonuclease (patch repair protein)
MDTNPPKKRSEVMRSIRKKGTAPEMRVRRLAHSLGYRFRLHRKDLPGTPDLTFPGRRKVILVHGCFWHQHPGCKLCRQPKSNLEYWLPKLQRNVDRDKLVRAALTDTGWGCLIVWECETTQPELLKMKVATFLDAATEA